MKAKNEPVSREATGFVRAIGYQFSRSYWKLDNSSATLGMHVQTFQTVCNSHGVRVKRQIAVGDVRDRQTASEDLNQSHNEACASAHHLIIDLNVGLPYPMESISVSGFARL